MKPTHAALALVLLATTAPRNGLPEGITPWWPSRYGAEHRIGTLNEIAPQGILAALRLIKKGGVVDIGRILNGDTPRFPGRYWHQTADATAQYANRRRPDADGNGWGKNRIIWRRKNWPRARFTSSCSYRRTGKTRGSTAAVVAPTAVYLQAVEKGPILKPDNNIEYLLVSCVATVCICLAYKCVFQQPVNPTIGRGK